MAQSPQEMADKMVANMPEKTGKPLADWVAIVKASGLEKHGEMVKLLKSEHGMTHGFANLVAHEVRGGVATRLPDPSSDLVAAQYAGDKAVLRPIHDAIADAVAGFGGDVEQAPKKTYVSLRRAKQFALVQPSTKTRVDVGINLKDVPSQGRLEVSGSFNGMVSHRVRLGSVADVDAELIEWLRMAYDRAG